jgi:putative PIN family toxin of toxin-antitoxin system
MRVVLDSSILVAALRSSRGASRQLLLRAIDGRFTLLLSVPLVIEYESVLTRPEHLEAARATVSDVAVILDGLVSVAEPIRLSFRWRPALPDPADDMVLETAVNGRAELLVTFDRRHFVDAGRRFNVRVLSPADALVELRGQE